MAVMERPEPDLLVIGRFARLVGLSVGALRHYDELGLLRPARVDPESGYRSYRRDQLEAARTIVRLRGLEVPLDTIRAWLATDDPAARQRLLADHRARIEARTIRLQRVLHILGQPSAASPSDQEVPPVSTIPLDPITDLDAATHRELGKALFNQVWTLLEIEDRSPEQTDDMIHAAHASRAHWTRAEGPGSAEAARGEWQCSRVYAALGRGEPALWHARRCLAIHEAAGRADWDLASAYEALARASAVAGDATAAADWKARATTALDGIADRDDRDIIEGDLATLP